MRIFWIAIVFACFGCAHSQVSTSSAIETIKWFDNLAVIDSVSNIYLTPGRQIIANDTLIFFRVDKYRFDTDGKFIDVRSEGVWTAEVVAARIIDKYVGGIESIIRGNEDVVRGNEDITEGAADTLQAHVLYNGMRRFNIDFNWKAELDKVMKERGLIR